MYATHALALAIHQEQLRHQAAKSARLIEIERRKHFIYKNFPIGHFPIIALTIKRDSELQKSKTVSIYFYPNLFQIRKESTFSKSSESTFPLKLPYFTSHGIS